MTVTRNFGWTLGSRVVYALSQWLIIVVLARIAGTDQLGEFTYALAVASPIVILAHLNLRSFIATDASQQFSFYTYLGAQYITVCIALVALIVVSLSATISMSTASVILAVGIYKLLEAISAIYYGELQRHERMREIAISIIMHGVLSFLAMALMLYLSHSVLFGALVIGVIWLLILLLYDKKIFLRLKGTHHPKEILPFNLIRNAYRVIKYCFPLGVSLALLSLRINIPVYFIQLQLGVSYVGIYSAMVYFIVAGNMFTGSMLQTVSARMTNYYRDENYSSAYKLLKRLLLISISVGVLGVLIVAVFGFDILKLVYGAVYAEYHKAFIWIMLSCAALYLSQVFGLVLTIQRNFAHQVTSNILGVIGTVVSCYVLVIEYGILGAAQSFFVGSTICCMANAWFVYRSMLFISKVSKLGETKEPSLIK